MPLAISRIARSSRICLLSVLLAILLLSFCVAGAGLDPWGPSVSYAFPPDTTSTTNPHNRW